MILGHDEIETDAKLFAVSVINGVQPFVLDQSMVLLEAVVLDTKELISFRGFLEMIEVSQQVIPIQRLM